MPEIHKLLKSQKNDVFENLREAGFAPSNFSWIDVDLRPSEDKVVPRLNYLDGNYYFEFRLYDHGHYCIFSPSVEQTLQCEYPESWQSQMYYLSMWIDCLKREIEAPDLWTKMDKYKPTLSLLPVEQLTNEPIPPDEVKKIEAKLQLLADELKKQFKLNEGQNRFVRKEFEFLEDASKHQSRRAWAFLLIGVLINIAMKYPDRVKQFWELVENILGPFARLLNP